MPQKKRVIAVFDFDDTLITTDSLPDFLRFATPPLQFAVRSIRALPMLILFKLGYIQNSTAKERLLTIFLEDTPVTHFKNMCQLYRQRLNDLTNTKALKRVTWHQERGDEVIIVSASVEDWIKPWAQEHGITTVIATKLATNDHDKLSGRLDGPNCYGSEKAARFLQAYPNRNQYTLYAYGDGESDKQIFELADLVFERKFE